MFPYTLGCRRLSFDAEAALYIKSWTCFSITDVSHLRKFWLAGQRWNLLTDGSQCVSRKWNHSPSNKSSRPSGFSQNRVMSGIFVAAGVGLFSVFLNRSMDVALYTV